MIDGSVWRKPKKKNAKDPFVLNFRRIQKTADVVVYWIDGASRGTAAASAVIRWSYGNNGKIKSKEERVSVLKGDAVEAEANALNTAIDWAAETMQARKHYFFTDCHQLITSMKTNRFVSTVQEACHAKLASTKQAIFLLHCTKALGNIKADEAAKTKLSQVINPTTGTSLLQHKIYYKILKEAVCPKMKSQGIMEEYSKNSKLMKIASRLSTQACALNSYLLKIRVSKTSDCPYCPGTEETLVHFLIECPQFAIHRCELQSEPSNFQLQVDFVARCCRKF